MTTLRKAFSHAVAMAVLAMSLACGKPLNPDGPPFCTTGETTATKSLRSAIQYSKISV